MKKDNIINSFISISHIKDLSELDINYEKKVSFKEIYLISKNPENYKNTLEFESILKNKNLSMVFFNFLKNNCKYFIPQAIAASSEINSREFDGGKIIINHSNKKDDVIYVTLILTGRESNKPKKIYIGRDDLFGSIDLSVFIDNQSQIMIKQTDRIYKMLVDPNMEIFIR